MVVTDPVSINIYNKILGSYTARVRMVCFAYRAFFLQGTLDDLGQFVCTKFDTWTKKTKKFATHSGRHYHQLAMTQAESLKTMIQKPMASIENQLREITASEIAKNRYILKSLADAILLCDRQGIALRGHRDDSTAESDSNKGTFLALLDYSVRSGNEVLAKHLKEASKNATYTSKTTQNDLIQAIGNYLRDKLLLEIKKDKWYAILCDEVTDVLNKEQVSFVIRFVDTNCQIREEFLEFFDTDRITGEVLACKIKENLTKWNIDSGLQRPRLRWC